ncbi:TRAP transporter large permease [Bacillus sp. CMF12]|uniref:TRAP transporter large permease n=1 Tax=Bacillaceae TaxID=186817 RepID=UPI001FB3E36C|nr:MULTISPECIES: TRAP transporter large permease [Bacillaceae]MDF2039386.1 TRAP transporter large permease [Cytobacillus oceanisediminis]UOE56845.1 TRAP transporter large permease [Cytobacillus oceanisediminis]USK51337.1 TRAP transporter large permease [Bacillus sp. CMF12]
MSPEVIGVIGILLLLTLILLRVSVGLSLFLVGFLGVSWLSDWSVGLSQLGSSAFGSANNYGLSVIPLFILMGMFMSNTGLGKDLFVAVDKWIGHFRGGLAIATVGAASIFSAISGSSNATTATLSKICIPEMNEYQYKKTFSTAAVAAGGTLGVLIPPSVLLIIYGALTSEPIGPLLIGGLVPGILMTLLFMLMINIQVRLNPEIAPTKQVVSTTKEKFSSLRGIWPFLLIFAISIGGIYFGVFTPSEAGGIGAIGAFVLTVLTKRLKFKGLLSSLDETLRLTVMLFLILIGAALFGKFLALSQIPMYLTTLVGGLDVSPYVILALILVVYFILGMFLEGIAIMTLTLPIVYPIITQLGFDGLWFGIIMIMLINIGVLTPPLGLSVYIISGVVKDVPIEKIFRGVIPAICTMAVLTIILIIFPEIVTFLPSMIK